MDKDKYIKELEEKVAKLEKENEELIETITLFCNGVMSDKRLDKLIKNEKIIKRLKK